MQINAPVQRLSFDITGMTCAACSTRLEKVLSRLDGVSGAKVNLALERADLIADSSLSSEAVIQSVERAGYGAHLRLGGKEAEKESERRAARQLADERQTLMRFALSAIAAIVLFMAAIPPMAGLGPALLSPTGQALLCLWVFVFSGTRFFREAWAALRGGTTNMAVLVTIGTAAAFLFSLWKLSDPHAAHDHLYFESAAVVLTLVMLGKYLEAKARRGASAALLSLSRLVPDVAERIIPAGTESVSIMSLRIGDVIRIRPGGRIPADGEIVLGTSEVDEALITGESMPVAKNESDLLMAGALNGTGVLDMRVAALGPETRLGRMTSLVEMTQLSEAPIQKMVDKVSSVFVPMIILLALVTFGGWFWQTGDFELAFVNAVAVLVIACPCGLGLATPTALAAGTGAAARAGILVRDIEALEGAKTIKCVAFDKTGTLTTGSARLANFKVEQGFDEKETLSVALALEEVSEHPLAKALVERVRAMGIEKAEVSKIWIVPGNSIAGILDGKNVSIGKAAPVPGAAAAAVTSAALTINGRIAARFDFTDEPRPEAAAAVKSLRERGVACVMLTGDNLSTAAKVGKLVGIENIHADLLPDQKLTRIDALKGQYGGVAFVGDGVNDAPALAAADIGLALSTGTDIARETAAFTLMRPDLRLVPEALHIAERTRRTMAQNLGWAFIYNIVAIPLAAFGYLSPVIAGAAMAFSSVSVVTNSAYLARWRPSFERMSPAKAPEH